MTYLEFDEIDRLFVELDKSRNPHVKVITEICLETGCRWGEAQGLTRADVHARMVRFEDTKNDEDRSVPISAELEKKILTGAGHGPLFSNSMDAFKNAAERAGLKLPKG
ncbi:MAG: tyrosine-type recombinase/integrase [Pseudomonadales bacterium]|nr:tyrosine-type recombinase/integrase [Pseudomonadales bacterium]